MQDGSLNVENVLWANTVLASGTALGIVVGVLCLYNAIVPFSFSSSIFFMCSGCSVSRWSEI